MTEREEHLEEAIREELVNLWTDLHSSITFSSVNLDPWNERSGWSIEMLGIADRIGALTKLVGPTSWEDVPVDLLLDGWWTATHERAGLDVPAFDEDRARAVRARRSG